MSALAAVAMVVLLQPAAARGALGTARPLECSLEGGLKAANAWERAKEPNLRRYCDLLASGTAKLVGVGSSVLVKDVPQIADEADRLLPGRAAPSVLKGRAHLRLGEVDAALAALVEARKREERALDDPVALLAWARANARSKHPKEAAEAYRAALPRASALSAAERSSAAFEAGMTVMGQGAPNLDDAIAMFRQARRDAQDAMQVASVVGLALALDRAGQREEAKAVLAERVRSDVKPLLTDPKVTAALTDAGATAEADAMLGLALEAIDPIAAREAWRRYADGAKGPYADHAREHAVGAAAPKKAKTVR